MPNNTIGLTGREKEAGKHHRNGRAKGEISSKKQQHNRDPDERSNNGYHTVHRENQQELTGSGKKIKEHKKEGTVEVFGEEAMRASSINRRHTNRGS